MGIVTYIPHTKFTIGRRGNRQEFSRASELLRAIAYNKAASGAIEGADRFFAGLAAGATGDLSNALREKLYGEQAVGNQSGLEYWAGYAIGTGLGAAVGSGATRLVSLYNRIMDAIGTAQSIYEVVTSVADVLTNCDDPQEVLAELFQLSRQRLQDALFERVLGDLGGRRLGVGPSSSSGLPSGPPAGAGGGPPLGVTGRSGDGLAEFDIPEWATPEQAEQMRRYCELCNEARDAGALSPTGRVSTKGSLRRQASRSARRERRRAAAEGTPYNGAAGHVPDTTWTGTPDPYTWLDLNESVNSSLGSQSLRYPEGFKPTEFRIRGE